jgi:TonB family protein
MSLTSRDSAATVANLGNYRQLLWSALARHKPRAGQRGSATVSFAINSRGRLAFVRVSRSSGNARLDQLTLRPHEAQLHFPHRHRIYAHAHRQFALIFIVLCFYADVPGFPGLPSPELRLGDRRWTRSTRVGSCACSDVLSCSSRASRSAPSNRSNCPRISVANSR